MKAEIRQVRARVRVEPEELGRAVRAVEMEAAVGTAAVCHVELGIWDADAADYDRVAAEALMPGDSFELWETETPSCLGLFYVEERAPLYSAEGSTVTVTAYDALRRLVKETRSRVYTNAQNDAVWLSNLAAEHDLKLDVNPAELKSFAGDRFKELGKTDLDFLTTVAMAQGLGMPRVRYNLKGGPESAVEMLVMRRLDTARQDADTLDLRVMRPDGDGDLESFQCTWDAGDVPEAVETVGWDPSTGRAFRLTVVATPSGPRVESVETDHIEAKELAQVRPRKGASSQVILNLLGSSREQVDSSTVYTVKTPKVRRIRAKREMREVLYSTVVEGVASAREYALRWMATRLEGYYTCEGTIKADAVGAPRLRIDQVHRVSGTLPEDEGAYILTRVSHAFGEQHQCSFSGQRLLEVKVR